MIDLNEKDLSLVRKILKQHLQGEEVIVFGSRISGKASKYSDLDLAIRGNEPIDWQTLESLRDAFAESDLPISIDILDWHSISDKFQEVIEEKHVVLRLDS